MINFGIFTVSYNGSHIDTFVDYITNHLAEKFILVADTDKTTEASFMNKIKELEQDRVFMIGKKEFEDLFSNNIISIVFNKIFTKKDGSDWKAEEIQVLRNTTPNKTFLSNISKAINDETDTYWDKLAFAQGIADCCSNEDIPEVIIEIFDKAIEIGKTIK